MSKLDIIVTHYDEPWEICRPFFDMIEHQTSILYEDFTVTLVQDGKETSLPWIQLLKQYSFKTNILTIPHSGPAAARNTGIKYTSAEWILFCDIDDRFNDCCALAMILSQLPQRDYDIIWGRMIAEELWNGEGRFLQKNDSPNYYNTDCKFYRREFLEENRIKFEMNVPMHYQQMFNDLVLEIVKPFRVVMLTIDFYMYIKTHRVGSMRQPMEKMREMLSTRIKRDWLLAMTYRKRGMQFAYQKKIAFIVCLEYFRIFRPDAEETQTPFSDEFLEFYRAHRNILKQVPQVELDVIKEAAETETMSLIQAIYNEHKVEYYLANDTLSFDEWLETVEAALDGKNDDVLPITGRKETERKVMEDREPVVISNNPYMIRGEAYDGARQISEDPGQQITAQEKTAPAPEREPRVVVYCGTYNTYLNMATSAKSLLWHTKVDKIYFLIEDDTFPYDLPGDGIIECINVKDQKWFPSTGPNYNNSWSYMCMMRAAFTKLIPYDKILSLDIDVVIQEDIGCLWDYDLTNYYLAGVAEPQRQKSTADPLYINFGVVMMNLAKIRADGIDDQIITALNRDKFGCPEQDAFNKFCAWHILQLPNDYNATVHSHITGEYERERIIHYAGIKFWRHYGQVKEYANKTWEEVIVQQDNIARREEKQHETR